MRGGRIAMVVSLVAVAYAVGYLRLDPRAMVDVATRLVPLGLASALMTPGPSRPIGPRVVLATCGWSALAVTVILLPYASNYWSLRQAAPIMLGLSFILGMQGLLIRMAVQTVVQPNSDRSSWTTLVALGASGVLAATAVFHSGSVALASAIGAVVPVFALPLAAALFWRKELAVSMIRDLATIAIPFQFLVLLTAVFYGDLSGTAAAALGALPVVGTWALARRRIPAGVSGLGSYGLRSAVYLVAVLAGGCGLSPSGGRVTSGRVGFVLEGQALRLMADQDPTTLRIRVFKVADDVTTDQEGNDRDFAIGPDGGTFVVGGVKLGLKEFQLDVLNGDGEILGEGEVRHLVRPGAQTAPEVSIRLRVGPRRRDVDTSLAVRLVVPGEDPKVTYRDVKSTLDTRCVGCHTQAGGHSPDGGLDLADFPFVHLTRTMTQAQIVDEMVMWMREPNALYRMPPGPNPVAEPEIGRFEAWARDGLLKDQPSDQVLDLARKIKVDWRLVGGTEAGSLLIERGSDAEWPFEATCRDMVVRGAYDYRLTVLGLDDQVVFSEDVEQVIVDERGAWQYVIEIPYTPPDVTIPVVIEP